MWDRFKLIVKAYIVRLKELFWQFYKEVLYERDNPSYPPGSVGAYVMIFKEYFLAKVPKNPFGTFILRFFWPVRQLWFFRQISVLVYRKFFRYVFHTAFVCRIMQFFEQYFFVFYYMGYFCLFLYFQITSSIFDPRVLNHMFLVFFCVLYSTHQLYLYQGRNLPRLNVLLCYLLLFVLILFFLFGFDLPGSFVILPAAVAVKLPWVLLFSFFFVSFVFWVLFTFMNVVILDEVIDYAQRLFFFINMVNLLLLFPWLIYRLWSGEVNYWIDLWTYYRLVACLNGTFFFSIVVWNQSRADSSKQDAIDHEQWVAALPRDERRYQRIFDKNIWIFTKEPILFFKVLLSINAVIFVYLIPFIFEWKPYPSSYFYIRIYIKFFLLFVFFAFLQAYYVYWYTNRRFDLYWAKKNKKR